MVLSNLINQLCTALVELSPVAELDSLINQLCTALVNLLTPLGL